MHNHGKAHRKTCRFYIDDIFSYMNWHIPSSNFKLQFSKNYLISLLTTNAKKSRLAFFKTMCFSMLPVDHMMFCRSYLQRNP